MINSMYDINSFEDLVDFYAGPKGVQAKFGRSQPWASKLKNHGIPTGYHLRIYLELRQAGKTVNPELFEIDGPLAAAMNDMPVAAE